MPKEDVGPDLLASSRRKSTQWDRDCDEISILMWVCVNSEQLPESNTTRREAKRVGMQIRKGHMLKNKDSRP